LKSPPKAEIAFLARTFPFKGFPGRLSDERDRMVADELSAHFAPTID
jgi:hypothetical protein